MQCQDCGSNDAFVHLTEITDGEVNSIWLCSLCSLKRQAKRQPSFPKPPIDGDDSESLASFLGEDFNQPDQPSAQIAVKTCPSCDYSLDQWQKNNLLGCPRCYQAFSAAMAPHLTRFHGHATHFGKFPQHHLEGTNQLASIKRVRVALEKAVAREDFEEAARQRDLLRVLKTGKDEES